MLLKKPAFKILLIIPVFFPNNSPQSLRWYHFVKYLANNGHKIDIITGVVNKKSNNLVDDQFALHNVSLQRVYEPYHALLNRACKLVSLDQRSNTSYKLFFFKKIIKNWFSFLKNIALSPYPDTFVFWAVFSSFKARKQLKKEKYDFIISSGYPFSAHICAMFSMLFYSSCLTPTWIGDFGDPWSLTPYISKRVSLLKMKLDRLIESVILRKMDYLIVTNEQTKSGYLKQFNFLIQSNIIVSPQGFDEKMMSNVGMKAATKASNEIAFVYTGTFDKEFRNPSSFFQALSNIEHRLSNVKVYLAGKKSKFVLDMVQEYKLSGVVKILGELNHRDALILQRSADLLILFGNKSPYAIPGKTYEYFGLTIPIFCIDYENSITAKMVKDYKRGSTSLITNVKEIENALIEQIDLVSSKQTTLNLVPIKKFSWDRIACHLCESLDKALK